MPTGVRTDIFNPDGDHVSISSDFVILYVGRIDKHIKGFDILVEALSLLQERGCQFRCLVVGAQNPNPSLTQPYKPTEYVDYVGFVPRAQLPRYYRSADVFVNPSRIETDGNTCVEALACGIPVVGSDIPAFQDKATLTFQCGDSADLADSLEAFYVRREALQEKTRARAAHWGIQPAIEKFVSVYDQVLSGE